MIHKIKIWFHYADDVLSGKKNFEVRYDDRGYNVGDLIEFRVIDHFEGNDISDHELNFKRYKITYIHSGLGLKTGFVVLGIKEAIYEYINYNNESQEQEREEKNECG